MMFQLKSPKTKLATLQVFLCTVLVFVLSGCATSHPAPSSTRPFSFSQDTLSFANELSWEYFYDANGRWRSKQRQPAPEYTQHCFVVSRAARQFFIHARFDATLPKVDEAHYRQIAVTVLHRSYTKVSPEPERVVVPGYPNLREFSRDYAALLRDKSGSAWHSYFQRGHWRMMLPFSAHGQEKMAATIAAEIKGNFAPIIHLVRFPQLTINHAAVLFDVKETPDAMEFSMYDPNYPEKPATLTFDRKTKRFVLPANTYFPGGRVNVYEIYRSFFL